LSRGLSPLAVYLELCILLFLAALWQPLRMKNFKKASGSFNIDGVGQNRKMNI
jgi:hypothetical protein